MYTREQIIEEIKRIAKEIGSKSLKEEEFERHSTIPISTVRFHIGSWNRALLDAGLQIPGKSINTFGKREPKHDDELLLDLLRLNEDSGEVPTLALIQEKGKYSDRHYRDRWKSIAEAFALAREKFPKTPIKTEIPKAPEINQDIHKEREPVYENEKTTSEPEFQEEPQLEPQPESPLDNIEDEGVGMEMDVNGEALKMNTNTKIKFIPQTIKPKKAIKKRRFLGETLNFRGLRFAPTNKEAVIYLFGMISHELGFIIESFREEFPSAEGKRCLVIEGADTTDQQSWEQVKIEFEYKSSDFQAHDFSADQCDIIVCWFHDWDDSPVEVLELKSTINYLIES
jgi:hypothetical protein